MEIATIIAVIGVLVAAAALGEPLDAPTLLGVALTLSGVALSTLSTRR